MRQRVVGEKFYFVMPDRFANGDPSNDTAGVDPAQGRLVHGLDPTDKGFYHGGDLAGLADKLDYLDTMGITAVWMTPMFKNRWVQGSGADVSAGYHGYWMPTSRRSTRTWAPTRSSRTWSTEAHALGIQVFMDIITNHTADVIQLEGNAGYRNKTDFPYLDANGVAFDDADYAGHIVPSHRSTRQISFPYTLESRRLVKKTPRIRRG